MISVFQKKRIIDVAMGREKADLVIKGGKVVNVFTGEIYIADVAIAEGVICGIGKYSGAKTVSAKGKYVCPGLIDAHFHIESTRATPREVIRHALAHGNTAFIADPHEIANVLGMEGVSYMLFETENVPFGAFFSAPSCVPSAKGEENGAKIDVADLEKLACLPRVVALGEMMDAPAVIEGDKTELEKIEALGTKAIDGHILDDRQSALNAYFASGIMTNHETVSPRHAVEQLRLGAYLQVRQGSASKNARPLFEGLKEAGVSLKRVLMCTDDKHIEDIAQRGLTIEPLRIAVAAGIDPVDAIRMATINTAEAYKLDRIGAVAPGRYADIVLFKDIETFAVEKVFYHGELISERGSLPDVQPLNCNGELKQTMKMRYVTASEVELKLGKNARVINLVPDTLLTRETREEVPRDGGLFRPNRELAKLCVIERHKSTGHIGLGIVRGFAIENGCIATTVSHDSHNFIAVTDNDDDLLMAIDAVNRMGGGMAVVSKGEVVAKMPLPVAGLMSDAAFDAIEEQAGGLEKAARALGVPEGVEPFMSLSFLALTAIGDIRLTTRGLFSVATQQVLPISAGAIRKSTAKKG